MVLVALFLASTKNICEEWTMNKVKKAIIPAAGLGTRFLPATKTVPKEMLTIVDAPIILYVVEEALSAGIEDIVLIQGRGKTAIEDFFDTSYELEDKLVKSGNIHLLSRVQAVRERCNIISIRQKQALGLGHAVLCGESVVGDEPFALLLGDEIMMPKANEPTVTQLLCESYEANLKSCIAVMEVPTSEVNKYGIADVTPIAPGQFKVNSLIEKPSPEVAPSRWALPGRYVLRGNIFDELKKAKPSVNGEIQLTDSLNRHAQTHGMIACTFGCTRFDAGDKLGYLKANIEIALENAELGPQLKAYLKGLI
jgi:UTP--glucose-1-phosphate uridylyltransferase